MLELVLPSSPTALKTPVAGMSGAILSSIVGVSKPGGAVRLTSWVLSSLASCLAILDRPLSMTPSWALTSKVYTPSENFLAT